MQYAVCSYSTIIRSHCFYSTTIRSHCFYRGGGEEEENQQVEEVESKLHTLTAYLHCIDSVQLKDCSTIDS